MDNIKITSADLNTQSYQTNLHKAKEKKKDYLNNNFEPVKNKVKVNISKSTINLSSVKSFAENSPDIRFEKVNSLKEKISQGNYNINPNVIAEKIIG